MLCDYANIFGAPGSGAHRHRLVGDFAAVDLLATAGGAFLLTGFTLGWKNPLAYALVFIILILAGILAHFIFCVDTRLNVAIFGRRHPPSGGGDSVKKSPHVPACSAPR